MVEEKREIEKTDMERAMARVKALQMLMRTAPDHGFAMEKIEETHKRWLHSEYDVEIEFVCLTDSGEGNRFTRLKEDIEWRNEMDAEFAKIVPQKVLLNTMASGGYRNIDSLITTQLRALKSFLLKYRVTILGMPTLIALVSHTVYGYVLYATFGWENNPYEPLMDLLERGFIPRRSEGVWYLGYYPVV